MRLLALAIGARLGERSKLHRAKADAETRPPNVLPAFQVLYMLHFPFILRIKTNCLCVTNVHILAVPTKGVLCHTDVRHYQHTDVR